jgi:hypothetical protein
VGNIPSGARRTPTESRGFADPPHGGGAHVERTALYRRTIVTSQPSLEHGADSRTGVRPERTNRTQEVAGSHPAGSVEKALRIGSALASIAPYDQAQSLIRQSAFGINERCSDGTLHRQTAPLGPRHICRGRGEHQRRRGDRGTLDQRLDRALSTGAPPAECRLRKAEGRGFDPRRPLSRPRRGSHKLAADRYFWRCGAPAKKNGRPE